MLSRDLGEQAIPLCEETHPVVVGVDGGGAALRAALWASVLAEPLSAPLLIRGLRHSPPTRRRNRRSSCVVDATRG